MTDFEAMIRLTSGLLASGQFTEFDNRNDAMMPKRYDAGETWKEDGMKRRYHSQVIDNAALLLKEIKEYTGME